MGMFCSWGAIWKSVQLTVLCCLVAFGYYGVVVDKISFSGAKTKKTAIVMCGSVYVGLVPLRLTETCAPKARGAPTSEVGARWRDDQSIVCKV
jgi:hypothetical protein